MKAQPATVKKKTTEPLVNRTIRFAPESLAQAEKYDIDIPDYCRKSLDAAIELVKAKKKK